MINFLRQSTRILPPGYRCTVRIDPLHNALQIILLNVLGVVLFSLSGWLFLQFALRVRPHPILPAGSLTISSFAGLWWIILWLLAISVGVVLLHETAHGVFFHLFTGSRPKFSLGLLAASASAPGWYIPAGRFAVIGLAPLVLLSLLALGLILTVPDEALMAVLVGAALNAGGAIADLMVVAMLAVQPKGCLARDEGAVIEFYNRLED